MSNLPLLSIIVPTLNAQSYLSHFLESIDKQDYPKNKREVIIADGGSSDKTMQIAKKYRATIIKNPYVLGQAGVYVGMKQAKGELFMVLPGDNIFSRKDAISLIVGIFKNKNIYAAFPKHSSDKNDSLFTKYINTFTDPFNHFIYGYASNARTFKKIYQTIESNDSFDIYDFKSHAFKPVLGVTQGFTVRNDFLKFWKKKDKNDDFLPIFTLIKNNKKIAYAHSVELYHHTIRNLDHFVRKQRWATRNALDKQLYGIKSREKTLTVKQKLKLYFYVPYAFSIIPPIIRGTYGLIKDGGKIWLFHPFISFISASAIIYEYIRLKLGFNKEVSRL